MLEKSSLNSLRPQTTAHGAFLEEQGQGAYSCGKTASQGPGDELRENLLPAKRKVVTSFTSLVVLTQTTAPPF